MALKRVQMRIVEMTTGLSIGLVQGAAWTGEEFAAFSVFAGAFVPVLVFGLVSPFVCALVTRSVCAPESSRWMGSDPAHFNALYWLFWYAASTGITGAFAGWGEAPPDGYFVVHAFFVAFGLGALGSSWLINILGPRKPDERRAPAGKGSGWWGEGE